MNRHERSAANANQSLPSGYACVMVIGLFVHLFTFKSNHVLGRGRSPGPMEYTLTVLLGNLILTSDRPGFTAVGGFGGEPVDFTPPTSSADKASCGASRARPRWPSVGPRRNPGQCGWNVPKLPFGALVQIVRQRKFGRCRCLDPIPISITQPARLARSQAALRGGRPACPT